MRGKRWIKRDEKKEIRGKNKRKKIRKKRWKKKDKNK